jgi:hypothetical protein
MTRRVCRPALVLAATLAMAVVAGSPSAARTAAPVVVAQEPPSAESGSLALADGTLRRETGDGGRLVLVSPGGEVRVLTAAFESAADPDVSFDGRTILFAGRREAGEAWCVWEMNADGSDAHEITCGPGEARRPVYLPPMYTLNPTATDTWRQIAFVGTLPGETNEVGVGPHTALYACTREGTRLRRLTYSLSSDDDPTLLPDGRLVFASWQRHSLDRGRLGRVSLFAVQTDGVDLMIFSGDEGRRVKHMPAYAGDRLVVFVEAERIEADGSGSLAAVSLRRNLHSYRALSGPGDGPYRSPSTDPEGGVLVGWRPGRGQGSYGIVHVDPRSGRRTPVFDDPAWDDVEAKALSPRVVPDHRSSSVQDADPEGGFYGLDVSISDLGPGVFPPGMARRLRVLEGMPLAAGESAPPLAPRRLLGEADLAPDGSFHVTVPANVPIQLQLLDEDGLALRSCGWIWVRNHERRGCVGCHEDPERTPPNRFALALGTPPAQLTLPPDRRRRVTFDRDVRPIFERRCLSCHGEDGAPPRLDAGGPAGATGGYRRLLESQVVPGKARTSPLVWHLLGRRADRPWDAVEGDPEPAPMPAEGGPLTAEELRAVIEWIDFGASWDGGGSMPVPSDDHRHGGGR